MADLEADGCDTPLAAMCSLGEQGARENVNVPEGPSTTAEENGFSLARCQLQNTTLNDLPGVIRITQQDVADALAEIEMKKASGKSTPRQAQDDVVVSFRSCESPPAAKRAKVCKTGSGSPTCSSSEKQIERKMNRSRSNLQQNCDPSGMNGKSGHAKGKLRLRRHVDAAGNVQPETNIAVNLIKAMERGRWMEASKAAFTVEFWLRIAILHQEEETSKDLKFLASSIEFVAGELVQQTDVELLNSFCPLFKRAMALDGLVCSPICQAVLLIHQNLAANSFQKLDLTDVDMQARQKLYDSRLFKSFLTQRFQNRLSLLKQREALKRPKKHLEAMMLIGSQTAPEKELPGLQLAAQVWDSKLNMSEMISACFYTNAAEMMDWDSLERWRIFCVFGNIDMLGMEIRIKYSAHDIFAAFETMDQAGISPADIPNDWVQREYGLMKEVAARIGWPPLDIVPTEGEREGSSRTPLSDWERYLTQAIGHNVRRQAEKEREDSFSNPNGICVGDRVANISPRCQMKMKGMAMFVISLQPGSGYAKVSVLEGPLEGAIKRIRLRCLTKISDPTSPNDSDETIEMGPCADSKTDEEDICEEMPLEDEY